MMRQAVALFPAESDKPTVSPSQFTFEKGMTIKGKKNSKVKIIANRKKHNYWGNIFRRKRIMSEYFSDSAFGSQSDTKIELYNPWEDEEKMQKHRFMQFIEYQYDENETMPPTTKDKISFMNDPESFSKQQQKQNNKEEDKKQE